MLKFIVPILLLLIAPFFAAGQEITGDWSGILEVPGGSLKIVISISRNEAGELGSMLQAPAQSPKKFKAGTTTFEGGVLRMEVAELGASYSATLKGDSLVEGMYRQGATIPVNMIRGKGAKAVPKLRPQEPKPPFPYATEEVSIQNEKDGFALSGTLTIPPTRGRHACAILISGSGPQNRDEELLGHKPFLVLADYLTRQGIAVLRVDDRGVGKSGGVFSGATSADFAGDVRASIAYLKTRKDIQKKEIGLIGHSEGGIVGSMVAADNKNVDFLVLLAGPGVSGEQVLLQQQGDIARVQGADESDIAAIRSRNEGAFRILLHPKDTGKRVEELMAYLQSLQEEDPDNEQTGSTDAVLAAQVAAMNNPWMRFFLAYDPGAALRRVDCPVLALNGGKDLQVNAAQNLPAIRNALAGGGNKNVTTEELPGLNHLFQESVTGNPAEYGVIQQTFSVAALSKIGEWLRKQLR